MKYSYRNYPIIQKIHNGRLGISPILEEDKGMFSNDRSLKIFIESWKYAVNKNKDVIFKLSEPFINAFEQSKEKLLIELFDILNNNKSDLIFNKIFIYKNSVIIIDQIFDKDTDDFQSAFFEFTPDGIPIRFQHTKNGNIVSWVSNSIISIEDKKKQPQLVFDNNGKYISHYTAIVLFMKYAEIETKELPPKTKVKDSTGKDYNDTDIKITQLDSLWFTNLVKSEAFKVRGHFRLQPVKINNEWTKKLIWINEFEKSGYRRKATKTINEESVGAQ